MSKSGTERKYGFPKADFGRNTDIHPGRKYCQDKRVDFTYVNDGDVLHYGGYHLQMVETPGHTPGHMCLYDADKKILFCGDHILGTITPNICIELSTENPLNDYLESLKKVEQLDEIIRNLEATAQQYTRGVDQENGFLAHFRKYDNITELTRGMLVELVKEITVLDNLLVACTREYRSNLLVQALGLPSLRREEEALKEKARRVLKFMGLESYANWLAFGLPYGILKKVEIARALMSDARLIIMDEPAAGLNDSETAELTETIRRIRDEFGVTILLVEHDMSLVMNVCDTVCAISFGKMLAIGTCQEIKQNKAVQEAYLGIEEV